jgi:hypothetical protein
MLRAVKGHADTTPDLSTARDVYIAKILQNTIPDGGDGYFNEADSDGIKVQKIKNLFKLDVVDFVKLGAEFGFLGRVEITNAGVPNSVFSGFHKNTRFAGIPEARNVGGVIKYYDLLNDSGLNCKPEIPVFENQEGAGTIGDVVFNKILLRALFKSSFYNITTMHTLYINDVSATTIDQEVELGGIATGAEKRYIGDSIVLEDRVMLTANKLYDIILRITNSEGTSESSSLRISIQPGLVQLKFGATLDAAIAGTLTDVYISQKISSANSEDGVVFYSNLIMTEYSSLGYYVSTTPNASGRYSYYRVTDSVGSVTEIGEYVDRYVDTYYYYSSVGVTEALQSSYVQRTLWYEILIIGGEGQLEKRQYYTSRAANAAYVASGFYVKSDQTTSLEVLADGIAWVIIPERE